MRKYTTAEHLPVHHLLLCFLLGLELNVASSMQAQCVFPLISAPFLLLLLLLLLLMLLLC
jgi:hypothetical protein